MKRPRPLRISETAYSHMRVHTRVVDAIAVLREARTDADVLAASDADYAYVQAAIGQALGLLMDVRDATRPQTRQS